METATMGRVTVPAKIESLKDWLLAKDGAISADQIQTIEVPDALVDTGATMLSLPTRMIKQLGLRQFTSRTARTGAGIVTVKIYDAVRLTVQERDCTIDVAEVPDDCPVLIGQIPLELFDFVIDPVGRRLIGNPEHGGQWMYDMF